MYTYTFAKYVDTVDLQEDLVTAGLGTYVHSISLQDKTLTIVMKYQLSEYEEQILRKTILAHVPMDPTVAANKPRIDHAMDFGRLILAEYATMNSLAKVPVPVLLQLMSQLLPLQMALQSGSLYTALDLMSKLPNSPYLSPITIKYFANKIRKYLGLPLQ